jgi:uncharacterized membrane protein (DUF485 family)
VPVFKFSHEEQRQGMAGNVRENLEALGCNVTYLHGNTSTKTRLIDLRSKQHIVRIDNDVESTPITFATEIPTIYNAIVISDYNKGTVSYELIEELRQEFAGPIFVDTKKTDLARLEGCIVKINSLENSLNQLYNAYTNANINSQTIIDHQKDMAMIVNEETNRLKEKKSQIDDKMFEATRMVYLNENYRKKQNAFNYILLTFVLFTICFIFIFYLKNNVSFIPEMIINVLFMIVISSAIIVISNMLINIYYTRNEFDYDKIKTPPIPANLQNKKSQDNNLNKEYGDLLSLNFKNQCIGASCCTKPNIWDVGSGTCVAPNTDTNSPNTLLDLTSSTLKYISPENCKTNNKKVCGMTCMESSSQCYKEGFEVMPAYSLYKSIYN